MAKTSDIIFCLNAQNIEGTGVSANNILTAITPEYIPGLFSFSVVVTLIDMDCSQKHNFSVRFLDSSDEIVVNVDGETPIYSDNSNVPNEYKGLNLAMDWNNVNLKKSGIYTIKIYIDEDLIGEKSVYVKGKNE